MKNYLVSACAVALMAAVSAQAQDAAPTTPTTPPAPTTPETTTPEKTGKGATVTREDIMGQGDPILDENGVQKKDANGNLLFAEKVIGTKRTVTTPSGIVHTMTKTEGGRTVVTHDRSGLAKPERIARADRPEKPSRPEKAERPERPARPEKPGRP